MAFTGERQAVGSPAPGEGRLSQARNIFNSGRGGWLPSVLARLTAQRRTPWVAFTVYLPGHDRYPEVAGGVVVVALIWGAIAYARDRTLGSRVGSIVADTD